MIRAVIERKEPALPTHNVKDLFVIPYGSRWTIRYETGISLKLYKTVDEALEDAWHRASIHGSQVWIQDVKGHRKKAKLPR